MTVTCTLVLATIDVVLYRLAREAGSSRQWHLIPGAGFYIAYRRLRSAAPVESPKSLWDEATDLKPGGITVITDKRNGNQYALMHLDDFDHLIGTGNKFVRKSVSAGDGNE